MNSAAEVIRTARSNAHLTQQRLAALAGISPARISEYETGKKNPTVETLRRIVSATGSVLDIRLVPAPVHRQQVRKLAEESVRRSMAIEGKAFTEQPGHRSAGTDRLLARLKTLAE